MTPPEGEKKRSREHRTLDPEGDPLAEAAEQAAEGRFLPELLRRGLTLGFTGFFMTEEALRRALGDSMPRDWVEFFIEQSDRTRAEFLDRISREFGRVLTALDPVEVVRRLLDGQTLEVSARIRLSNGERQRTRVSVRRTEPGEDDA